jgi:hypothetical protein
MTNDEREWEELANRWRESDPVRLDGLAERTRRRNRWSALLLAGETLLSVAALGVLGWLLSTGPGPLWLVWTAFMATMTVTLLAFSFRARAGTWRAPKPGTVGLVELALRQTRSSIRLARGGILATLLVLAFTAGWAAFEGWQLGEPTVAELRRRALVYGGVLLYGVGWLLGCRQWIRRQRSSLARLERSLQER